ncbi:hypothetical protein V6N12_041040 [Hibiscus sabdariffa]|uniref:Uncharacterized protein n=1 Tax=Hibiscus sabdariffa TaxID=183260 RepID=A0ABR2E7B8_9ROSI
MHRHSCVASFDFDLNMPPTQESTYNPYSAEAGQSSLYHEARSPYDHEMFNPFDDFSSDRYSTYIPSSRNVDEYSQQSREQSPGSHHETVADEADLFRFIDAPGDEEPIMKPRLEGDEMGLFNDDPEDLEEPNNADNDETDQQSVPQHWRAEGSSSSTVSFFDVSSHFTTVDYEAFNTNEFPELNEFIQRMSMEDPCLPIKEVQQPVGDNEIRRTPYMLCGKPQPRSSKLGCAHP